MLPDQHPAPPAAGGSTGLPASAAGNTMPMSNARCGQKTIPFSLRRPGPGYRLAFVSIPVFLETCLVVRLAASFRTAPPVVFLPRDFAVDIFSPDEIECINQFKALKKQVEWMTGRYAAKQLARHFLSGQPALPDTRVAYRDKGAPYFTSAPALSLSISHSWDYAVAGLGLLPACILGLDLEKIRPESRSTLLRTAFSEREVRALQSKDDGALYLNWTAKEAYLKYIGQGFHESLKRVEIIDNTILHDARPVPFLALTRHLLLPGYAFSMVC